MIRLYRLWYRTKLAFMRARLGNCPTPLTAPMSCSQWVGHYGPHTVSSREWRLHAPRPESPVHGKDRDRG